MAHDEQMPRRQCVGVVGGRQSEAWQYGQAGQVGVRHTAAIRVVSVQCAQSLAQKGGLQLIQPGIDPGEFMVILDARAIVREPSKPVGEGRVIGGDRSPVAQCTEVLARIEAERRSIAEAATGLAAEPRTVGLCRVFEQLQAATSGDLAEFAHRGGPAIKVYRNDGPGPRRDGCFDAGGIDVAAAWRGLDRYRPCADFADCQPRRNEGVRRHDHLVVGADVPGAQCQVQGIEAIAHTDAMRGAAPGGELPLEGGGFLAKQQSAAVQDARQRCFVGRTVSVVDALQVEERNRRVGHQIRLSATVRSAQAASRTALRRLP